MRTAVYPGSFDPITNGHYDIICRAAAIFDRLIVMIAINKNKKPLFDLKERMELVKEVVSRLPNVEVDCFEGLLMHYMEEIGAGFIVRGLRAISDFEFEFQLDLMNKKLNGGVETVFLMTRADYSYVSSSLVKEVASLQGCVDSLVPREVKEKLEEKFRSKEEV
jgi:pantetheine-phosphate adenylyltransferase